MLTGGPWIIGGHYLTVRQWAPNFDPSVDVINKVIAWIRFPGLPVEYYNSLALTRMGSLVGKVIQIDRNTEDAVRGRFARLCVEVDLSKALLPKLVVGKHIQTVEYEGLHMICFHCGRFGHRREGCPSVIVNEQPNQNAAPPPEKSADKEDDSIFGPWMIAQRRSRKSQSTSSEKGKSNSKSDSRVDSGNRFAALSDNSSLNANGGIKAIMVLPILGRVVFLVVSLSKVRVGRILLIRERKRRTRRFLCMGRIWLHVEPCITLLWASKHHLFSTRAHRRAFLLGLV